MADRPQHDSSFQASAHQHLWRHFAGFGSSEPDEIPMIVRGEGAYIWDDHGRRLIDGLASLYTVNVGHGRESIADAMFRQAKELAYFPVWDRATRPAVELAQKIARLAPGVDGARILNGFGA